MPNFENSGSTVLFDRFQIHAPTPWHIDPQTHTLTTQFTLHPGERIALTLVMQDSSTPHTDARDALESAIAFWQHWANQCTYQGRYRDEVIRSALTLKLMTYTPSGAIVAAPTTSFPEEIGGERNWDYRYTWIRDASFTLYALLLAGYLDNESPFFDWLRKRGFKSCIRLPPKGKPLNKRSNTCKATAILV